jgi:hypothetical protein
MGGPGSNYGGGGVYAEPRSTVTLINCTLANNVAGTAGGNGGGLFVRESGSVNLTNCTVSGNSAPYVSWNNYGVGSGIYVDAYGGILNLTNTIVAGNMAAGQIGDIYGKVATADHNLVGVGGYMWIATDLGGNLIGLNPLLGPLQNNGGPTQTMALLAGSPAIGHANNSKAPATDQRGVTRLDLAGEIADIGAFEL